MKKVAAIFTNVGLMFLSGYIFYLVAVMIFPADMTITEFRDFAGLRLSQCFIEGINPYQIQDIQSMNVPVLYLYPFSFSLLVALGCRVFDMNIIAMSYIISALFMIATVFFIGNIIRQYEVGGKGKLPFYLYTLIIAVHFFMVTEGTFIFFRPDCIGVCIYSALIYFVFLDRARYLYIGRIAVLSSLAILTKQYFIFIIIPIMIYYAMAGKKRLLQYTIIFSLSSLIILLVVHWLFPLFWTETIFMQQQAVAGGMSTNYLIHQLKDFFRRYWTLFLPGIFWGYYYGFFSFKDGTPHLKRFYQYLYVNILIMSLVLLYLGQNDGAYLSYFRQLLLVPLSLAAIIHLMDIKRAVGESNGRYVLLAFLLLSACLILKGGSFTWDYATSAANRKALYTSLDQYRCSEMFLSPNVAPYLLTRKDASNAYFDDGHLEYFSDITAQSIQRGHLLFPNADVLSRMADEYVIKINEKIINREFKVVITTDVNKVVKMESLRQGNYSLAKVVELRNGGQVMKTSVWIVDSD